MTIAVTFGQVLTCSLAAFAFARLRFPGRDKLFMGYLATMMIPGAVTLIPVYILFIKMPELLNFKRHCRIAEFDSTKLCSRSGAWK